MKVTRKFYYDDIGAHTVLTYHTPHGKVRVRVKHSLLADECGQSPWIVDIHGADGRELSRRFCSEQEAYDFGDDAVEDWMKQ